jgi:hypothetical protein
MCYDTEREKQAVEHLQDENKKLKEQIESANKCIKIYADWKNWLTMRRVWLHTNDYAKYYLEKWGVK